jgi:hypothetical protein
MYRAQFNPENDTEFLKDSSDFFDEKVFNDLRQFIENDRNESFFTGTSTAGLERELKNSQLQIDKLNYCIINYKYYNKIICQLLKARNEFAKRPTTRRHCKKSHKVCTIPRSCSLNHLPPGPQKSNWSDRPDPKEFDPVTTTMSSVSKNTVGNIVKKKGNTVGDDLGSLDVKNDRNQIKNISSQRDIG